MLIKIFASSVKMLNLSKSELRSIAKKGNVNAINISKPTKNNKKNIFKSKRREIKESFMKLSKKKVLKPIIKEIKEILLDPIINRDEKIEEIKKTSI